MSKMLFLVYVLVSLGFAVIAVTGGDHVIGRAGFGLVLLALPVFLLGLNNLFSSKVRERTWLSVITVLGGGYFIWRALAGGPIGLALPDITLVLAILVTYQAVTMSGIGLKKAIIVVLAIVCVANVGIAVVQALSGSDYDFWEGSAKEASAVTGFFGHYNAFASFLNGAIFFFLSVALLGKGKIVRIGCILLVVGMLVALHLSGSRGGWISFVIGGVAWLIAINIWLVQQKSKWVGVSIIASFGLGVSGVLTSVLVVQKLSEKRAEHSDEGLPVEQDVIVDDGGRLDFQQMAIEVFQDGPVLGNGPRAFSYVSLQKWDPSELLFSNRPPEWVHNEYLQALTDYGAVGLVIILIVLLLHGILGCYSLFTESNGDVDPIFKIGALGGLVAVLCQCLFSFLMHFPSCAILCAFHLGILASSPRAFRSKGGFEMAGKVATGVLGIATSVSLILVSVPLFQSFRLSLKANQALANVVTAGDAFHALEILDEAGTAGRDPKIFEVAGRLAMTKAAVSMENKDRELAKRFNERARIAFEKALKYNPHFSPAIAGLPRVHDALGNALEAEKGHEKAMATLWAREFRLKPHYYAAKSAMMEGYRAMVGQDDLMALQHFRKALERISKRRELLERHWERPDEKSLRMEVEGWIAFHEARMLFRKGDDVWKNARPRNPGLAYGLMLEAQKRYRASEKVVRDKDSRWGRQVEQLEVNLNLFVTVRERPAQLTAEQIAKIVTPEAGLDSGPSNR